MYKVSFDRPWWSVVMPNSVWLSKVYILEKEKLVGNERLLVVKR